MHLEVVQLVSAPWDFNARAHAGMQGYNMPRHLTRTTLEQNANTGRLCTQLATNLRDLQLSSEGPISATKANTH